MSTAFITPGTNSTPEGSGGADLMPTHRHKKKKKAAYSKTAAAFRLKQ